MSYTEYKNLPGEKKDLYMQKLLIQQRKEPLLPLQLTSRLPKSPDLTIAEAKELLAKGKSINVIDKFNQVVLILTLTIPPPLANHNTARTFDLSDSILRDISSSYIRKVVTDIISPVRKEQFRYALRTFHTDEEYLDTINSDILKKIRPYSKTPKKYRLMNILHIVFTGLQNDEIIELLTESDFDLDCVVLYKGTQYTNVNLLMAEMEFNKIMNSPSEDLPNIEIPGVQWHEMDYFMRPWENFAKLYAKRYKIAVMPLLYDRRYEKEIELEFNENFVDLRVACQVVDAYARII